MNEGRMNDGYTQNLRRQKDPYTLSYLIRGNLAGTVANRFFFHAHEGRSISLSKHTNREGERKQRHTEGPTETDTESPFKQRQDRHTLELEACE